MRQHRSDVLAQIGQHRLEQLEGLALVFVERIALRIGTQVDPLPQVIERQEVVFPGLVQQLQ